MVKNYIYILSVMCGLMNSPVSATPHYDSSDKSLGKHYSNLTAADVITVTPEKFATFYERSWKTLSKKPEWNNLVHFSEYNAIAKKIDQYCASSPYVQTKEFDDLCEYYTVYRRIINGIFEINLTNIEQSIQDPEFKEAQKDVLSEYYKFSTLSNNKIAKVFVQIGKMDDQKIIQTVKILDEFIGFHKIDGTYHTLDGYVDPYIQRHTTYSNLIQENPYNVFFSQNGEILTNRGLYISRSYLCNCDMQLIHSAYNRDCEHPDLLSISHYNGQYGDKPFQVSDTLLRIDENNTLYHQIKQLIKFDALNFNFVPFPENSTESNVIKYAMLQDRFNYLEKQLKALKISSTPLKVIDVSTDGISNENVANMSLLTIADDRYSQNIVAEKTDIKQQMKALKKSIDLQIIAEQAERTRLVAADKIIGKSKNTNNKSKGTKGKKKVSEKQKSKSGHKVKIKPEFDDGFSVPEPKKFDVDASFNALKITTMTKYRNVIKIFQDIEKLSNDFGMLQNSESNTKFTMTQKGSHLNFHDPLGVFTFVRKHGGDDMVYPHDINHIIKRSLEGIQSIQNNK